jgi:hypothetical protein
MTDRRDYKWLYLTALLISFVLTNVGCSGSRGHTKVELDSDHSIPPDSTLAIRVEPSPKIAGKKYTNRGITELRTQLFGRAMSSGRFRSVVPYGQPANYLLDVELDGAYKTPVAAKVLLGSLSGMNRLSANVKLYQNEPYQLLESFSAIGISGSHWATGETSYQDAIRELVSEIEQGFQN